MKIEELEISGAWIAHSSILKDNRGNFREWFKADEIEAVTGIRFGVRQANISTSNKGVLRGIHYSIAPQGQAKWITCISGSIWDVVVDLRPSSSTFKKWISIELSAESGDAVFISDGLGHAFMSLEDNSTVAYLLTSPYSPTEEFEIFPLDPELAISWPQENPSLSAKDKSAPIFANRKLFN